MDATTELESMGIGAALAALTGAKPIIREYPDHYLLYWDEDGKKKVIQFLNDRITKMSSDKTVNPIQIDLLPVILPVAIKNGLPYVITGSVALVLLGMFLKGKI